MPDSEALVVVRSCHALSRGRKPTSLPCYIQAVVYKETSILPCQDRSHAELVMSGQVQDLEHPGMRRLPCHLRIPISHTHLDQLTQVEDEGVAGTSRGALPPAPALPLQHTEDSR